MHQHRHVKSHRDSLSFDITGQFPQSVGEGFRYAMVGMLKAGASKWKAGADEKTLVVDFTIRSQMNSRRTFQSPEIVQPRASMSAHASDIKEEFKTRYLIAFMKTLGKVFVAMKAIYVQAKNLCAIDRIHVDHAEQIQASPRLGLGSRSVLDLLCSWGAAFQCSR